MHPPVCAHGALDFIHPSAAESYSQTPPESMLDLWIPVNRSWSDLRGVKVIKRPVAARAGSADMIKVIQLIDSAAF